MDFALPAALAHHVSRGHGPFPERRDVEAAQRAWLRMIGRPCWQQQLRERTAAHGEETLQPLDVVVGPVDRFVDLFVI